MNWEAIGAVGEVGGAIAVVATLAYLAKQIRQNTAQARVQTDALEAGVTTSFLDLVARDEALSRIFRRGLAGEDLDEDETQRFALLMYLNLSNFENFYRQHRSGTMEPDQWEKWDSLLAWYVSQPGFRKWWNGNTVPLGPTIGRLVQERFDASSTS